jgi:hypothetical protein
MKNRTLNNTNPSEAKSSIEDLEVYGESTMWITIAKASSNSQGFMKSTKAMCIDGVGIMVQVTTQQKNPDGSWSIAEALQFVPGAVVDCTTPNEPYIRAADTCTEMFGDVVTEDDDDIFEKGEEDDANV